MKPFLIYYLLFLLSKVALAMDSILSDEVMIVNEGIIVPRASRMGEKPSHNRPAKGSNLRPSPGPKGRHLGIGTNGKFQLQTYGKCAPKDKEAILQAWEDSKLFSDALGLWTPRGDYQAAVTTYMEDRSTYKDLRGFDFPKQIRGAYPNF